MKSKERGQGRKFNFNYTSRGRSRSTCLRQLFTSEQNGMLCPLGASFGASSGYTVSTLRPAFGKFSRKYTSKKCLISNRDLQDIDLTKPWITQELRNEIKKKQELLDMWIKIKSSENWGKYEAQRHYVQVAHGKAKAEYLASHPGEVYVWENISTGTHYCETCDKSFRTEDDLLVHKAEHETCNRDGCKFSAHPKIISKHIKMQHKSGLFKRIGNLYTEEEISKWIEERKKRYPTKKAIEAKKILEQEKLKRGERIKDDNSRFNKSFNKSKAQNKNSFERLANKTPRSKRARRKNKITDLITEVEKEKLENFRKGVPAFTGIGNNNETQLSVKNEFDISDDDEWVIEYSTVSAVKPMLNNSLGLLAEFYHSEDEENTFRVTEKKGGTESALADDASAPEEVKTVCDKAPLVEKSDESRGVKRKFLEKKTHDKKKQNPTKLCNLEKKSLTLLEKLLKKEIRHERNVILQCIHFIVNQNFFRPL